MMMMIRMMFECIDPSDYEMRALEVFDFGLIRDVYV